MFNAYPDGIGENLALARACPVSDSPLPDSPATVMV
jgi:hypothetical protein